MPTRTAPRPVGVVVQLLVGFPYVVHVLIVRPRSTSASRYMRSLRPLGNAL